MRMDDHEESDGKRVWLSQDEIDLLIENSKSIEQEVGFTLAARSGLRRSEVVSVTPNDFNQAARGFVRVWGEYAKGGKYRETPIQTDLAAMVRGMGGAPDRPVVDVHPGSFNRWVKRAAEKCQAQTGDSGWRYLSAHDLRRTWGGHLLWDCGVLPAVVMSWGGWDDWKTFRDHYLGEMSPAAADRERSKIFRDAERSDPVFEPTVASDRGFAST